MVAEGIHGVGKLQVPSGSNLQGDRVACVVSRARVFTEVIPVDLGQTQVAGALIRAEERVDLELRAHVGDLGIDGGGVLALVKGGLHHVDLGREDVEDLLGLTRVARGVLCEPVPRSQEPVPLVLEVPAVTDGTDGAVKVSSQAVDLTVCYLQAVGQLEGLVLGNVRLSVVPGQGERVSEIAMLSKLEAAA